MRTPQNENLGVCVCKYVVRIYARIYAFFGFAYICAYAYAPTRTATSYRFCCSDMKLCWSSMEICLYARNLRYIRKNYATQIRFCHLKIKYAVLLLAYATRFLYKCWSSITGIASAIPVVKLLIRALSRSPYSFPNL